MFTNPGVLICAGLWILVSGILVAAAFFGDDLTWIAARAKALIAEYCSFF